MAYDASSDEAVLFGGRVGVDTSGSGVAHASAETWIYSGGRWTQRFPAHSPEARSIQSMVWNSRSDRVILFGGRTEAPNSKTVAPFLNDTWSWDGKDWHLVESATSPSNRVYAAIAYDSVNDRVVLFGGDVYGADGKTIEPVYDTWEFDGSQWTRLESAGAPEVRRPLLAYDPVREEMILLGINSSGGTLMYRYESASRVWEEVSPEKRPDCVTEGVLEWRPASQAVLYTGGVCQIDNTGAVKTWEWNGSEWTDLELNSPGRATGVAFAIDTRRDEGVLFGGVGLLSVSPRSLTLILDDNVWRFSTNVLRPGPRSLGAFVTDAARGTAWLFGGLVKDSDTSYFLDELWRYKNGQWNGVAAEEMPSCTNPLAAFDTDRQVMVVTCAGEEQTVYEWNGTEWKDFPDLSSRPKARRFAALVYDANVRKTVLFGGYDGIDYMRDTWTWDGTRWTEVKQDRPKHRALMAMWYDPLMKKTVVFGGLGRGTADDDRVERYTDMWAFNGSGWSELTVSSIPGERFGPLAAVDPRSGKVLLFGGLRTEKTGEKTYSQYYVNDLWQWDGSNSTWTRLTSLNSPPPRENGMFTYDPVADRMVIFGGYYGGLYYSDVWEWDGVEWTPRPGATGRRRAVTP